MVGAVVVYLSGSAVDPLRSFLTEGEKMLKMSDEEYFAHPALNQSSFKKFMVSPLNYKHFLDNPMKKTMAMTLGSMVHCHFLEPEEFSSRFSLFTGTKGMDTKQANEFRLNNPGKEIFSQQMHDQMVGMVACIKGHQLPAPSRREVVAISTILGIEVKAKADWIDDENWIWDLKTTANLDKWEYDSRKLRYDVQAQWYMNAFSEIEPQGFKWLVVGNSKPYDSRLFQAKTETLANATMDIIREMESFKVCQETDIWPGYPKIPMEI